MGWWIKDHEETITRCVCVLLDGSYRLSLVVLRLGDAADLELVKGENDGKFNYGKIGNDARGTSQD